MHLTNYAINKSNPNFIITDGSEHKAHKRTTQSVFYELESKGVDTTAIWNSIKDIIAKTVITAKPVMSHLYSTSC